MSSLATQKRQRRLLPEWLKVPVRKLFGRFACKKITSEKEVNCANKFEVTIEPLEQLASAPTAEGNHHQPVNVQAMTHQLEHIFRRYFARRVDQFALSDVRSARSALRRHRDLRHTKLVLASMIEFWEEQRQRERLEMGGVEEREQQEQDELETFMDVYFGTLYDLLSRSTHVLEQYFPAELQAPEQHRGAVQSAGRHYIKKCKNGSRTASSVADFGIDKRTSMSVKEGSIVNFDTATTVVLHGTEKEESVGEAGEKSVGPTQLRFQQQHRRPKSIVCYF